MKLFQDVFAGDTLVAELDGKLLQKDCRLARKGRVARVASLQIHHRREHICSKSATMLTFELAHQMQQYAKALVFIRFFDPQQMKGIGETAVTFLQNSEGF